MPDLTANSVMSANLVDAPMSYSDWVDNKYGHEVSSIPKGYGGMGGFVNWMTGFGDQNRDEYDLYKLQNDRQYELAKISDERAWNEYMMSTQYQRMAADLKAAGFNPGVVLSGGIGASGIPESSVASGTNSSHGLSRNNAAGDFGGMLGRIASTALMAVAMVATKGLAAAGKGAAGAAAATTAATKAAKEAARSAKLTASLNAALGKLK